MVGLLITTTTTATFDNKFTSAMAMIAAIAYKIFISATS